MLAFIYFYLLKDFIWDRVRAGERQRKGHERGWGRTRRRGRGKLSTEQGALGGAPSQDPGDSQSQLRNI